MCTPLVSIILPTYNRERFVTAAIDSALSQTYRHTEIIVVDDGSIDNTPAVVAGYGDRVRYIRQHNQGAATARNNAIAMSSGEYVAFLDSDDVWFSEKLSLQVGFLASRPEFGLVASHAMLVDEDGKAISDKPLYPDQSDDAVSMRTILMESPLTTSTLVVRRDCLPCPLPFSPDLRFGEDWQLCLRVASRSRVGYINRILVKSRRHGDNVTNPWAEQARVEECLENHLKVIAEVFDGLLVGHGEIGTSRAAVEAIGYASAAIGSYVNGEYGLAALRLATAIRLDPDNWITGGRLRDTVVARACLIAEVRGDREAHAFLEAFFGHLPPSMELGPQWQRAVHAHADIAIGFMYHRQHRFRKAARHLSLGLCRDPRWFRNRGVLSTLARSLSPALPLRTRS